MVFKYMIKLLNKNNAAFVLNFIYVIGDYVVRLLINIRPFYSGLKYDQDLFDSFFCFSGEK